MILKLLTFSIIAKEPEQAGHSDSLNLVREHYDVAGCRRSLTDTTPGAISPTINGAPQSADEKYATVTVDWGKKVRLGHCLLASRRAQLALSLPTSLRDGHHPSRSRKLA